MGVLIVGMVIGATSALASYFFGASAFWILITYIAAANVATIVCAVFVWLCPGRESGRETAPAQPGRGVQDDRLPGWGETIFADAATDLPHRGHRTNRIDRCGWVVLPVPPGHGFRETLSHLTDKTPGCRVRDAQEPRDVPHARAAGHLGRHVKEGTG